jgi:hypothetical protein
MNGTFPGDAEVLLVTPAKVPPPVAVPLKVPSAFTVKEKPVGRLNMSPPVLLTSRRGEMPRAKIIWNCAYSFFDYF